MILSVITPAPFGNLRKRPSAKIVSLTGRLAPPLRLAESADDASLGSRVLVTLRRAILSGAFKPGELITLRPLAMSLGVSPMPVREALSRLSADGVVETLRNRAFRLRIVDLKTFRELSLARLRLEALLCERAAARMESRRLERLNVLLGKITASGGVEPHAYLDLHRAFHFTIYEAADMLAVHDIVETLWLRLGPLMHASNVGGKVVIDQGFHARIFDAIERGEPSAAAQAVQDDIVASSRLIARHLGSLEAEDGRPEVSAPVQQARG